METSRLCVLGKGCSGFADRKRDGDRLRNRTDLGTPKTAAQTGMQTSTDRGRRDQIKVFKLEVGNATCGGGNISVITVTKPLKSTSSCPKDRTNMEKTR